MKVIEIKWGDAWVDTDDMPVKKARKSGPCVRYSVGYLVANNDDGYVLSGDRYKKEKGEVNTVSFIPHGMVLAVREFE